jgi:2-polyprenyl-3-methyl-5-hydroxy-6-metoxy-1,4-benzoquinol methylase
MRDTTDRVTGIDWAEHWTKLVRERSAASARVSDPSYWDRRAATFARSTRTRADAFLEVLAPYVSARKTLIDAGAGTGRHALPLAERLEWVTAVEPSEGMRALIPPRDNMTVIASTWEDAEVAPADLVICCHVLYGVEDPGPFIAKLDGSAREQAFVMLREGDIAHPATLIRERMGVVLPRMPQFSDLFALLMQMGIAPDVTFIRYPVAHRYGDLSEALADCRPLVGAEWDEARALAVLQETLTADGDELVFDGGVQLSGIAHWRPQTSS